MTWLSIVTVVRDDVSALNKTRASIEANDLDGVEWLVVDSSQEREAVEHLVSGIGRYEWVSPEGIYPAMNCGLERVEGEYVMFLNAGDELSSPHTLSCVRDLLAEQPCAWAYGHIEIIEASRISVLSSTWDYEVEKHHFFARGSFPPHQATFTRASDLRALEGFDTSYRIAADYKAFLQLTQRADPRVLPIVVARFPTGGASSQHWYRSLAEFHRARVEVLALSGKASIRERALTAVQSVRVGAYRLVVAPVRRLARR